jgi:hypothetical protein
MKKICIALAGAGLLTAGCTTTGNVERGAFSGAAIGAIAGAVIGNNVGAGDAGTGAAIGRRPRRQRRRGARLPAGRRLQRPCGRPPAVLRSARGPLLLL